jgi:hypothetical protein
MADEKSDPRSLQQTVKEAWLSVLGVFTTAENEVNRATSKLLETMGIQPDAEGNHHVAAELMARVKKNSAEIERKIDEGVKAAVTRVRAPLEKELASVKTRLEQMQARFDELQKRGQKNPAKRKKDE